MTELDYDPEFKKVPMWTQFGKILDSQTLEGVIKPKKLRKVTTVVTDDGKEFTLTAKEVQNLKDIVLAFPMPIRRDVFRKIQLNNGLATIVKVKNEKVSDNLLIKIWDEMNESNK